MAQRLQIVYTCLCCGKKFYVTEGKEITLQQFLDNDLCSTKYDTEFHNGFCINCVAGIHFKDDGNGF